MDFLNELQKEGVITPDVAVAAGKQVEQGTSPEKALLSSGVAKEVVRERLARYYNIPAHVPTEDESVPQNVLDEVLVGEPGEDILQKLLAVVPMW